MGEQDLPAVLEYRLRTFCRRLVGLAEDGGGGKSPLAKFGPAGPDLRVGAGQTGLDRAYVVGMANNYLERAGRCREELVAIMVICLFAPSVPTPDQDACPGPLDQPSRDTSSPARIACSETQSQSQVLLSLGASRLPASMGGHGVDGLTSPEGAESPCPPVSEAACTSAHSSPATNKCATTDRNIHRAEIIRDAQVHADDADRIDYPCAGGPAEDELAATCPNESATEAADPLRKQQHRKVIQHKTARGASVASDVPSETVCTSPSKRFRSNHLHFNATCQVSDRVCAESPASRLCTAKYTRSASLNRVPVGSSKANKVTFTSQESERCGPQVVAGADRKADVGLRRHAACKAAEAPHTRTLADASTSDTTWENWRDWEDSDDEDCNFAPVRQLAASGSPSKYRFCRLESDVANSVSKSETQPGTAGSTAAATGTSKRPKLIREPAPGLLDGLHFALVNMPSAKARSLKRLVKQHGGEVVKLTPTYVQQQSTRNRSRLVCICADISESSELYLALALCGHNVLKPSWVQACFASHSTPRLVPPFGFQLIQSTKARPCAKHIGHVLPVTARVLRLCNGVRPMTLAVRATGEFRQKWEVRTATKAPESARLLCQYLPHTVQPVLRAAGAALVSNVASSNATKPLKVHAYLLDGTIKPSNQSKVPCVGLPWLQNCLQAQRRLPLDMRGCKEEGALHSLHRPMSQQF